jgi:uncharacterized protein with PQ loop repeat
MFRQRSSRDVSISYFAVLLVGFVLWLSYGIAARNLALIGRPVPVVAPEVMTWLGWL